MARPLRIEIAGGRYHVTSRGNERRPIFRDERDRCHFLELLEQWPPRFGVRLHAYVLMDNHYHLVLETPEANLSRAAQWLNLSYSAWFNRRHRHIRHLFQGRFKAIVLEGDAHVQQVARYVHLNPVRVMALDLGKSRRKAVAAGLAQTPRAEVIRQRLEVLRKYRWSSYGAVAGYRAAPEWLWVKLLQGLCGGRNQLERLKAVRLYTEQAVREGLAESPWEGLISGLVLGSEDYARQLFGGVKRNQREESAASRKRGRIDWGRYYGGCREPKERRGKDSANGAEIGDGTPLFGWGDSLGGCAWENWQRLVEAAITRLWPKRSAALESGWDTTEC